MAMLCDRLNEAQQEGATAQKTAQEQAQTEIERIEVEKDQQLRMSLELFQKELNEVCRAQCYATGHSACTDSSMAGSTEGTASRRAPCDPLRGSGAEERG